jgi:Fe-S-cluster-containing hydrogenase component 2
MEKCNGCAECVRKCPQGALEMTITMVDLEDKKVVAVSEGHRKKIKYTCAPCKPEEKKTPCITACTAGAITCIWKTS